MKRREMNGTVHEKAEISEMVVLRIRAVVFAGIFCALFAPAVYASSESCEAPLPDDVDIRTPSADVPEEYAGFSGHWGPEKWDDELCHVLVVETIDSEGEVEVIYSWGTSEQWNIKQAGWVRIIGRVLGSKLKLKLYDGKVDVNYWLDGDMLYGRFYGRSTVNVALMRKRISP